MTELPPPTAARPDVRARVWIAVVLAIGVALGADLSYERSRGAFLSGIGVFLLIAGLLAITVLIGLGAALARHRPVTRAAFSATAALVVGAIAGQVAAPVLGLRYVPPVVLQSTGTIRLGLDGIDGWQPRPAAPAECRSAADSTGLAKVTSNDLGQLAVDGRPMTLRGSVEWGQLGADGSADGIAVSIWVDAGDLPATMAQPFWNGAATGGTTGAGAAAVGTLDFSNLELTVAPGGAADDGRTWLARVQVAMADTADEPNGPPPDPGSWPATLSGAISWDCAGLPAASAGDRPDAGAGVGAGDAQRLVRVALSVIGSADVSVAASGVRATPHA